MPEDAVISGGCQCGALRYRVSTLGRSSVCHCRMCARAFGGFYAPLVVVEGLEWVSGTPNYFQSSNVSRRGFCAACGTPLTLENLDGSLVEVATGTLDDPEIAPPTVQINRAHGLSFTDGIGGLPVPDAEAVADNEAWNAGVVSYQRRLEGE
ncbi:MAG: GFA family protein [Pseudomonadota bacterium]